MLLKEICSLYENVVLVLNTGGPVDLSYLEEYKNIRGILQISQPGCEGDTLLRMWYPER